MIFHFILNPKSGRSRKKKKLESEIKEACLKRQLDYHIYYTTKFQKVKGGFYENRKKYFARIFTQSFLFGV